MAHASIPVDLFNPGQVFACVGFMEVADILLGEAAGAFAWQGNGTAAFLLKAGESPNAFSDVIEFLRANSTVVEWLSPVAELTERDGGATIIVDGVAASVAPNSAYLPARLSGFWNRERKSISFGYWADGSTRFHTIFKKSTFSASSFVRFNNALTALREMDFADSVRDPFAQSARTESLFRLDPRGSVDPIHAGTSPDKLRKGGIDVRVATYPICEALAVIGLENSRPREIERRGVSAFQYRVWHGMHERDGALLLLPLTLARVAIGSELPFVRMRKFLVTHEEVKSGGDRKISSVIEEND